MSGGCDGLVKLWKKSSESGRFEAETIAAHNAWIKDVAWAQYNTTGLTLPPEFLSGSGEVLAICAEDRTVSVLRKAEAKWREIELPTQKLQAVKLSWSIDGHVLAAACIDGTVVLYEETAPDRWDVLSAVKNSPQPSDEDKQAHA